MFPSVILTLTAFKNMVERVSRYQYYKSLGACETILSFTKTEGKTYGTDIEKITIEWFRLLPRLNTQHDGLFPDHKTEVIKCGHWKIEIKSSRYWGGKKQYKFQHIEPDHDFDILLTALLREDRIEYRIMRKNAILPYLEKQGKQGFFLNDKDVERIGTIIETHEDIYDYLTHVNVKLHFVDGKIKCDIISPK